MMDCNKIPYGQNCFKIITASLEEQYVLVDPCEYLQITGDNEMFCEFLNINLVEDAKACQINLGVE